MKNIQRLEKMLGLLDQSNKINRVKVRYNVLKSGNYSLYLDLYYKGRRTQQRLNIILSPDNPRNEELIKLALNKALVMQFDDADQDIGYKRPEKDRDFVEFYDDLAEKRNRRYKAAGKKLRAFTKGSIRFADIDSKWISDFRNYLVRDSDISTNTAWAYFGNIKAALRQAKIEGIIEKIPGSDLNISQEETERVWLTMDEVKRISEVEPKYPMVLDAFLFGCYTGLRISDIERLTWSNIQDGYVVLKQKKTKTPFRSPLTDQAKNILRHLDFESERVFDLPSRRTIQAELSRIVKAAGIDKDVTFHTSRHTFAVVALASGKVDFYTLSKLLGHKRRSTTERYAQIIDSTKDKAIERLSQAWSM